MLNKWLLFFTLLAPTPAPPVVSDYLLELNNDGFENRELATKQLTADTFRMYLAVKGSAGPRAEDELRLRLNRVRDDKSKAVRAYMRQRWPDGLPQIDALRYDRQAGEYRDTAVAACCGLDCPSIRQYLERVNNSNLDEDPRSWVPIKHRFGHGLQNWHAATSYLVEDLLTAGTPEWVVDLFVWRCHVLDEAVYGAMYRPGVPLP